MNSKLFKGKLNTNINSMTHAGKLLTTLSGNFTKLSPKYRLFQILNSFLSAMILMPISLVFSTVQQWVVYTSLRTTSFSNLSFTFTHYALIYCLLRARKCQWRICACYSIRTTFLAFLGGQLPLKKLLLISSLLLLKVIFLCRVLVEL